MSIKQLPASLSIATAAHIVHPLGLRMSTDQLRDCVKQDKRKAVLESCTPNPAPRTDDEADASETALMRFHENLDDLNAAQAAAIMEAISSPKTTDRDYCEIGRIVAAAIEDYLAPQMEVDSDDIEDWLNSERCNEADGLLEARK